ncbi:TlyA family RNA methyltransferase [Cohnella sp. GbtcB17]|uniref:TlyA family RNA methyltransferase n=1 Tax=Cohnella sp. GbtcB17 TaxID=2824762 RepID=UPI001C303D80|nr:TlyA family RNA methyltransferase [Cohnella sp. GbtcB17]
MSTITKERIDTLLVEQGFFESRAKAQSAIMAGLVLVGTEQVDKPGTKIPRDAALTVKGAVHPYVSRGGLKLEKAIREFGIDLKDTVMMDIGASTGGFTDCALQHGASFVYAIDVGYNQLDWSLRQNPQVCVMERCNFRHMTPEQLTGPAPVFASIDVSFISLKLILPALRPLLPPGAGTVALIKPQFEAGREQVGKSGVVRDRSVHLSVLREVLSAAGALGFALRGLAYSPITGGEGNIEFLAYWQVPETPSELPGGQPAEAPFDESLLDSVVEQAAARFKNRA